jgi:voltage-gated potassium channel Kch
MTNQRRIHLTPYWRQFARRWLATVICSLAIATLVCGFGGFAWQYADSMAIQNASSSQGDAPKPPPSQDWSIPVFKTVQLFLLNSGADDDSNHPSNWLLMVARLTAAALFLVVSGTVILRVLDDVRRLPSLLARRDHVVICGLGQIGLQLLDDLDKDNRAKDVIVIESNPANPWLEYARSMGATIVLGDSTKANTLSEARAAHAAEVFVVNGDDGVNLEVTAELGMLMPRSRKGKPLRLYVHIVDTHFATTLRPYCKVLHDSPNISIQIFNVPRTAAARLVSDQLWPHAPKKETEVAHFVVLGFGAMGQALAIQLAQLGHFPNRKRNRFTIADRDISTTATTFLSRFPRFTSWTSGETAKLGIDSFSPESDAWVWNNHPLPDSLKVDSRHAIQYVCNAEFVNLPAGRSDEAFAKRLGQMFAEDGVTPVIFICGQQDRDNFEMAVQLRDQLSCQGQRDVPIFVWLPRQPALAETLSRTKDGNFVPFGECRSAASYQEITDPIRERIGRKIHDDYEDQAIKAGYRQTKQPWSALRDDFRESNRVAADHLTIKLAAIGLRLRRSSESPAQPVKFDKITKPQAQLLAEMEHNRWVAERLLAGWRYAAEGKTSEETQENKKRKLNHNMIAWDRLGEDRKKDFDQVRTILRECQKDRFCVEVLKD